MIAGGRVERIVAQRIVRALISMIRDVRRIGKRMDDMELWP